MPAFAHCCPGKNGDREKAKVWMCGIQVYCLNGRPPHGRGGRASTDGLVASHLSNTPEYLNELFSRTL